MRKAFGLLLLMAVFGFTENQKAVVIPISGTIDPGLRNFIERATKDAVTASVNAIVYEIDSFGGEVESALEISDIITSVPPSIRTIAYVKTKAISAGALIALSCQQLVMKENTTIGDCAPIVYGQEGPKMLGEKFQSPLRAKFRSLAKKNNYPSLLSESMVSDDIEVLHVREDSTWRFLSRTQYDDLNDSDKKRITEKKTLVRKGQLLTLEAHEAKTLGFAAWVVGSREEAFSRYGLSSATAPLAMTWSESFVRWIRKIAPFLLLIGLAGIALEIKSPGLIWPAAVGAFCLALVFGGQYLTGMADYAEAVLFIIGILLIVVEIHFIPGFGLAGIAGVALVIASLVLSLQDFVVPKPEFPWQYKTLQKNLLIVSSSLVGSVLLLILSARWITTSPVFRKMVLEASEKREEGYVAGSGDSTSLEGQEGIAQTILRPSGTAIIQNKRFDVESEGEFISPGTPVRVIRVQGSRIIVRKTD